MDLGSPILFTGSVGFLLALLFAFAPQSSFSLVAPLNAFGVSRADVQAIRLLPIYQLVLAALAVAASAVSFVLALRGRRDRPTTISIVCAAGTFACIAWFHAVTTLDVGSGIAALVSSAFTAWGITAATGLPKSGKQPPRAASPLYLSGLTLVLFGAALYVAPVLTSSLLGRILSPLSGLAGLPALPPVWRLALPALATAFGAQLQHLAASGSEREHTRYCRALAAGFVAAGLVFLNTAFVDQATQVGGAAVNFVAGVLVVVSEHFSKKL